MSAPAVRHLFLDLEDTVVSPAVPGWSACELLPINVARIRQFIHSWKPDFLHVFSFAIWNRAEKQQFSAVLKPVLEAQLQMTFSWVLTTDEDIRPACCQVLGLHPSAVDFDDASAFWGKHESFRLFLRNKFSQAEGRPDVHAVLFDDAVLNEEFRWPDLRIQGQLINIDCLPNGV